jgi:hypothetical protein
MLRISERTTDEFTTVYLEGKLLNPWIAEVRAVVGAARRNGPVRLALTQLWFADNAGLDLLNKMRMNGIHLVGSSALIESLLAGS